jgi:ketosteroid isomerase-like protein
MTKIDLPRVRPSSFIPCALVVIAIVLLQAPMSAIAADEMVTQTTLLDRIQIEDFLVRYYEDMGTGGGNDLARYYTEDGVLDVNGTIAKGRQEIQKLYGGPRDQGQAQSQARRQGRMHMLLSNPIITVSGDTAKAWVVWTGIMNDNVRATPRFLEQGREYDELVKQSGRWYVKHRYVTADSGMPARWDPTYKPREHR